MEAVQLELIEENFRVAAESCFLQRFGNDVYLHPRVDAEFLLRPDGHSSNVHSPTQLQWPCIPFVSRFVS